MLIALFSFCVNVCAQSDSIAATGHIDEVEVSASAYSNGLHSIVPQYSLTAGDFSRLNVSDITSALRRLPGITLRDYGGAGGMKTVSVRGLGSQHTGVALDGLLLADAQSGQTDMQQFLLSEISSLSLSVAGSNDIFQPARNLSRGSLLSITTSDTIQSTLSVEAGSWRHLASSARLNRALGRVVLSLQGGYVTSRNDYPFTVHNGIATHRENRNNSRLKQGNVSVAANWTVAPEVQLKSIVRLSDNDRQLPGLVRLYINENDETLRDRSALAQTILNSRLASRLWLKTGLRWSWTDQDYHNGAPSAGIRSERYIQREYYATVALLYTPHHDVDLCYSADVFHNSMTTTIRTNPNPRRNSFLQSISAKYRYRRFVLVANLLNSNVDTEHRLSPSLMLSYMPLSEHDLMVRLSAKDIFRMPTMTELYYYHFGAKDLRPENARQMNLGVTYASPRVFGRMNLRATADIYINKVSDKIVAIPYNMFVWRYTNLSQTLGRGADVTAALNCDMARWGTLSLTASYSYQRVGMREVYEKFADYQIAYVPEHSGGMTLAWINPWCNASATLTGASRQWANNEHNGEPLPAYSEVAASINRSFRISGERIIEATVTVQNLFGHEYSLIAHYPMPGRNIKININYKF